MKTIEVKVYSFNELSQEAKEVAISKFLDINVNFDWWGNTYEDAKQIGLKISSFDLDRNKHAKGEFILAANEVAQNVFNSHGEDCETYKTATNFMGEWQTVFNNYMDENHKLYESREAEETMQELETEFLNSILEDYANILQKESDYLQSEEAITETIEANYYQFLESGKLF